MIRLVVEECKHSLYVSGQWKQYYHIIVNEHQMFQFTALIELIYPLTILEASFMCIIIQSYTWAIILIYLKMLSYLSNVLPTLSVFYSIGKPTLLQSISFLFFGSINSFGFNLVPSVVTFEMAIISKPSRWKRTRSNFSLARIWHIYSFSIYESDWWIGMKLTFPWFGQFIRCFLILAFDQCLTQAIPLFFCLSWKPIFFVGKKSN